MGTGWAQPHDRSRPNKMERWVDLYSHVLPGMGAEAAKKVGDALTAAVANAK